MSKTRQKKQKLSTSKNPSATMVSLYGEDYARSVQERLNTLDPELNSVIQNVAYEIFWRREGLSLRDKALITVAALVAMGKEEQTRIHMTGFLNAGGNESELRNALLHLAIYCGFPATMNGFAALKDVLASRSETKTGPRKSTQSKR